MGSIAASAYRIRSDFAPWDAEKCFAGAAIGSRAPSAAESDMPCGEVLRGALDPRACPHFGDECTPEHPIGALMVSSEGACAACFRYAPRTVS